MTNEHNPYVWRQVLPRLPYLAGALLAWGIVIENVWLILAGALLAGMWEAAAI